MGTKDTSKSPGGESKKYESRVTHTQYCSESLRPNGLTPTVVASKDFTVTRTTRLLRSEKERKC